MPAPFLLPSLLFLAGMGFLAAAGAKLRVVQRRAFYRVPAAELGLRAHPGGFWSTGRTVMSGRLEGFEVAASLHTRDEREILQIVVDGTAREGGEIPRELRLGRQVVALRLVTPEDAITGDAGFDDQVLVGGRAPVALAVLTPAARRAFLAALERNLTARVEGGRVTIECAADGAGEEAVGAVRAAVALAGELVLPPGGVGFTLARRAVEDPLPGVRLHAFEAIAHQPGDLGTGDDDRAARRLLADPHPELRLRAAMRLGAEGVEVLARMVRTPAPKERPVKGERLWWELKLPDGASPPDEALFETVEAHELRRARALRHLAEHAPRELVVLPLVREALHGPGQLRAAALDALAVLGVPSLEPEALDALGSHDPGVRQAAVGALAAIGTAAAVPALRALAEGGFADRAVRRAAADAISRIQARLPGAAAGQVALAGAPDAAGRVSIAPDAGGRVALAPRETEG